MKTEFIRIFLVLIFFNVLFGCSLFKHAEKSTAVGNDSLAYLEGSGKIGISCKLLAFNNIEGRIKLNGRENTFNSSLKFVNDSLLVVSVTSLMNIEIFRIYINNDSVFLLDRTKREFEVNSFDSTIKKYSEFLTISSIGDLLLGNMISAFKSFKLIQLQNGKEFSKYGIILNANSDGLAKDIIISYVLENTTNKPVEFSMQSNESKFNILYNDYHLFEGSLFPGKVEVLVKKKGMDFLLNLEIGNLKRIENPNSHIFIPDGYKRRM